MLYSKKNQVPYTIFAKYYDDLLEHVDYKLWYHYIRDIWTKFGANINAPEGKNPKEKEIFLEIGCGTGFLTIPFYQNGFSILGLDASFPMLQRLVAKGYPIPLICAEMGNFSLNRKFAFIFSVHDTVNYLTSLYEIEQFLKNVYGHLQEDGIFLFDLTTEYNILQNFHENSETFEFQDTIITWSNLYNRKEKVISSKLQFNLKTEGGCKKVEEVHYQKIYDIEEIKNLVQRAGFTIIGIFGDQSFYDPASNSTMINFLVKRRG